MASKLALIALLPVSAGIAFGIALLFFYRGGYEPPPPVDLPVEEITAPKLALQTFVDSPVPQVKRGLLLVDLMHANAFAKNEIITLSARVAGRGYEVEFAEPGFDQEFSQEAPRKPAGRETWKRSCDAPTAFW